MSVFAHSRKSSNDSVKSTNSGASYAVILEHLQSYPGTYEIPLRTMYSLNCAPRAQPIPNQSRSASPTSSNENSPTSPTFAPDYQAATTQFTCALMSEISKLPQQHTSLPAAFVTSFVTRCFPAQLEMVDFPQSLTALDYLRDLESRRRKEIAASLKRIGIDEGALESPDRIEELKNSNASVADWVESLGNKERKVEALYTNLYISLRRWILINEMCLEPFHKHNCHAMLNTLYPPVMSTQPTAKLTIPILTKQRDGFFKYIQTVEKRGNKDCLNNLISQNKLEGEVTGWPAVKRTLTQYLTLANSMINECWDVNNVAYNPTQPLLPPDEEPINVMDIDTDKRKGRKVDSGISMGNDSLHSKTASTSSMKSSFSQYSQHSQYSQQQPRPETPIGKAGSTLERIAREFRKMKPKQRVEVSEIIPQQHHNVEQENGNAAASKTTMSRLRKMKSLGALNELKHSNSSQGSLRTGSRLPVFDPAEMKRQRDAFEKRAGGA
ncbi:Serine/threonine-protein kinase [Venturia nashicola]|uniref:Serine/threonine-protein kinase n=1 Tax=Venturia nashicola TaxID=86259 RepID=A0A4Z1PAY9_9PEZI|nr:Serine/threonine-protein kinase [Venturia nashicola]TLD35184.1 Serine/threonine-protein kinase [Venturia nashicola]